MDGVSSESRSGLHSGYTGALVFMVPTMEPVGRRVAEWRVSLLDRGLKGNAGKSKVMVGSSDVPSSGFAISALNKNTLRSRYPSDATGLITECT